MSDSVCKFTKNFCFFGFGLIFRIIFQVFSKELVVNIATYLMQCYSMHATAKFPLRELRHRETTWSVFICVLLLCLKHMWKISCACPSVCGVFTNDGERTWCMAKFEFFSLKNICCSCCSIEREREEWKHILTMTFIQYCSCKPGSKRHLAVLNLSGEFYWFRVKFDGIFHEYIGKSTKYLTPVI